MDTSAASAPFLLATDLDGTFLAGTARNRSQLYRLVEGSDGVRLAWVTGRGLEAVLPLLSDPGLPDPDFLICDVGATVIRTADMQPLQPIQSEIESRWPGEKAVADAMQVFADLVRQDVPQQRRCSYYCDPERLDRVRPDIERMAHQLGCEVLYSADRYLDILPRATDKGRTLSDLVAQLGLDTDQVLVAGDTLNDLSMFTEGYAGVCVGESESGLLDATSGLDQVLHAEQTGCGGILQAIEHFDLVGDGHARRFRTSATATGKAELVMVYHRLPYEEVMQDGVRQRRRHSSPNGIIPSLLSFFADGRRGSWVAWSVEEKKGAGFEVHTPVDPERYPDLTAARVPLSKQEIDVFYKRFSKEAFWPVINVFWERARFHEEDWLVFKRVNRRFAEAAAAEAAPGATVWLHDYNLWMVPATLRALRPDLKIAFFHHTQFPAADIFNILPWRREIIGSLLACDYIGFHIPRHVENFVDAVRSAMPTEVLAQESCAPRFLTYGCAVGVDKVTTELKAGNRRVRLGAHPIGTDVDRIRETLAADGVQQEIEAIRAEIGDRKLVLSIERLDYSKGVLEKLLAYEHLLESEPELAGRVTLVIVCVPAAKEMTVFRSLQTHIDQAVGRISGRFSTLDWVPVRFFARSLPFPRVVAHYAAADVMWITPLRDGLNLVAKEFVAVQGLRGTNGVLVLSEFAGAAAELKGALLTNPHDPADLAATLKLALTMPPAEREDRQRGLFEIVSHFDLAHWGNEFLAAVEN
jgi:glucosylglycerol-phosphate synthase